jgi:hypothetical protein
LLIVLLIDSLFKEKAFLVILEIGDDVFFVN